MSANFVESAAFPLDHTQALLVVRVCKVHFLGSCSLRSGVRLSCALRVGSGPLHASSSVNTPSSSGSSSSARRNTSGRPYHWLSTPRAPLQGSEDDRFVEWDHTFSTALRASNRKKYAFLRLSFGTIFGGESLVGEAKLDLAHLNADACPKRVLLPVQEPLLTAERGPDAPQLVPLSSISTVSSAFPSASASASASTSTCASTTSASTTSASTSASASASISTSASSSSSASTTSSSLQAITSPSQPACTSARSVGDLKPAKPGLFKRMEQKRLEKARAQVRARLEVLVTLIPRHALLASFWRRLALCYCSVKPREDPLLADPPSLPASARTSSSSSSTCSPAFACDSPAAAAPGQGESFLTKDHVRSMVLDCNAQQELSPEQEAILASIFGAAATLPLSTWLDLLSPALPSSTLPSSTLATAPVSEARSLFDLDDELLCLLGEGVSSQPGAPAPAESMLIPVERTVSMPTTTDTTLSTGPLPSSDKKSTTTVSSLRCASASEPGNGSSSTAQLDVFADADVSSLLRSSMTEQQARLDPLARVRDEQAELRAYPETVWVVDRSSGKVIKEKIPTFIKAALRIMYQKRGWRSSVKTTAVKNLLRRMTFRQREKYLDPGSRREILPFIQFHELDVDEIRDPLDSFANFNEFFYRHLKPDARPLCAPDDDRIAVQPADCRLHVFPHVDLAQELWIKGENFSVPNLLWSQEDGSLYEGGSLVIARLAPQDYHRYHFPVSGTMLPPIHYEDGGGLYYTVNPIAVRQNVDVFTLNRRCKIFVESPEFGRVCIVCIGATMVGAIEITAQAGPVRKGDELGFFAFGGSTLIVLFQKNTIHFDSDLLLNSSKPIETIVKVNDRLGVSVAQPRKQQHLTKV